MNAVGHSHLGIGILYTLNGIWLITPLAWMNYCTKMFRAKTKPIITQI
jgi:hypothetical protein